jgi:hypothetical protein
MSSTDFSQIRLVRDMAVQSNVEQSSSPDWVDHDSSAVPIAHEAQKLSISHRPLDFWITHKCFASRNSKSENVESGYFRFRSFRANPLAHNRLIRISELSVI